MYRWQAKKALQALVLILLCSLVSIPVVSVEQPKTPLAQGKAMTLKLCQACHEFKGASQAGTVGPPFIQMSQRFPQRDRIRAIIYDPQKAIKPHTMMPPFGRHGFLDKKDIELVIDFLYTL